MLLLGNTMPKFIQIVCLYLQVLLDLIWLHLEFMLLLSFALQFRLHAQLLALEFFFAVLFPKGEYFDSVFGLLDKQTDFVDEFFALKHYFTVQLQLMAVRQLEVAVNANWIHFCVRLWQPSFHLAIWTDRCSAFPAVMPLKSNTKLNWARLTVFPLVEIFFLDHAELKRQVFEVFTFTFVLSRFNCWLIHFLFSTFIELKWTW